MNFRNDEIIEELVSSIEEMSGHQGEFRLHTILFIIGFNSGHKIVHENPSLNTLAFTYKTISKKIEIS